MIVYFATGDSYLGRRVSHLLYEGVIYYDVIVYRDLQTCAALI